MLDTALMDVCGGGQAENFFFTGPDGGVRLKAERLRSLKSIEKELRSSATTSDKRGGGRRGLTPQQLSERVVAMARTRSGEFVPLTSKALHTVVKAGSIPPDFECLQPFKRAKDYEATSEFANYQHRYVLDDTGGGVSTGVTHRRVGVELSGSREDQGSGTSALLGGGGGGGGGRGRTRSLLLSKNARVNTEVAAAVRSVAVAIERSKLCRVLRLDTEFVLDEDDEVWLAGVTLCEVAARPVFTGFLEAPRGQQGGALAGDRALATELRSRKREVEQTSDVIDDAKFSQLLRRVGYQSPTKGRAGGRPRRRPRAILYPTNRSSTTANGEDRTGVPGLTSTPLSQWVASNTEYTPEGASSRGSAGSATASFDWAAPDVSEGTTLSGLAQGVDRGVGGTAHRSPSPPRPDPGDGFNSSIVKLDQTATNRIYGSTQVEGCRGDFCDFDVDKLVREEEDHRYFVEKAARAAGAENGLVENLSPVRLKIVSMDEEDLGDGAPASSKSASAAVVRPGGRGPRVSRHPDVSSEQLEIPYKAVVQARQERPLVEAFLRQYARGQITAYHQFLDGHEGEEPYLVGGKYPGVYYRPVRVCRSCHKVYTLVDEARARALRNLRLSDGGGGRRQRPGSPRGGFDRPARDTKGVHGLPSDSSMLHAKPGENDGVEGSHSTANPNEARDEVLSSRDGYEHSSLSTSLAEARQAMDAISQGDISELRSFVRPPAAVLHVVSVAMSLLQAKSTDNAAASSSPWEVARAAMGRGDFLARLRAFDPRTVTPQGMSALTPALERSSLDPAVVRPLSNAASNLCLWILGVIQANRWLTGSGHTRTNTVPAEDDISRWGFDLLRKKRSAPGGSSVGAQPEQPFPQQRTQNGQQATSRRSRWASPSRSQARRKRGRVENRGVREAPADSGQGSSVPRRRTAAAGDSGIPGPATASPTFAGGDDLGFSVASDTGGSAQAGAATAGSPSRRARGGAGRVAAQAFASGRLANAGQPTLPEAVASKRGFVCSDGRTRLPYRVCGDPGTSGGPAESCNFVVVHDLFDNVDKTEVLFRPVTRRHRGCRVLTFSYPGQAGTVFRVPPSMLPGAPSSGNGAARSEAARTTAALSLPSGVGGHGSSGGGARNGVGKEVPNNAFIASKLHELLQHVHAVGEMSLASPFHLVGIGNGMATAAAFALRYGDHPLYRSSLRSVVSINGFSSVDSQLAAVLHSSLNAFATLPPKRPDLPISFMSRYIFSEEYLKKVGRNLALGIYTAVANPVSLEGRHLLCSSALLHEDLSGEVGSLGVPLVLLQSTEDVLVNPANVDPFLRGRSSIHHFWSHEFGNGGGGGGNSSDGETSSAGPASGSSVYGRKGLTDLLRALSKPRGTFVAWVRAGHEVCQEGKRAVVDLLDALAKPTHDHNGVHEADLLRGEAEGAVTLGLYPSGEWVARVNRRGGGRAVGEEGASLGSAGGGAAADEGVDGDVRFDPGQRDKGKPSELEGDGIGDDGDTEGGITTAAASPFPRDISIPTLPANIVGRHQAPNTSPIKRSHAGSFRPTATASPGRGIHRRVVGHGSGSRRQGRSVDAFGFDSEETVAGRCGRRHGRRQRGGRSGDQDQNSCGIGGELATKRGRPKVVWKDSTPAPSAADKREAWSASAIAPPSGSRNEEDDEERGSGTRGRDYSTSYFPSAALLYDNDGPASPPGKRAGVGGSANLSAVPPREGSRGEPGRGLSEEDPWDLVKNAPSLEFPPSGQHQRGNRRWVVSERPAAAAARGVGEDGSQSPSSMPTEATAGTTSSTQNGDADAGGEDTSTTPLGDLLEAEASLQGRLCEARRRAAERLVREDADAERRIASLTEEQRARSRAFAREDREMIAELEKQLAAERLARAPADLQRAVDGLDADDLILREGLVVPPAPAGRSLRDRNDRSSGGESGEGGEGVGGEACPPSPVRVMPPLDYSPLDDLPEELRRASDAYSLIDDAARDEAEMLRIRRAGGGGGGPMDLEKFQRDQAAAASEAAAWRLTTKKAFRKRSESELERARVEAALRFQPLARGVLGRKRARRLRDERDQRWKLSVAATKVQTVARVLIAKERARAAREAAIAELVLGGSALRLQSVGRGMLGRRRAARRRRQVQALAIQRCYRGHLGRRCAARQRAVLEHLKARNRAAVRLQAWWRCRAAVSGYARTRATSIAAVEIQRCYRGVIGRKKAARRREWERSKPGPERLKLGVRLIEDSKAAFEAQRMEIAALHSAGERAVVRTSRIRRELGTSEKELTALEREMTEIDHIEEELSQLSHQRNLVQLGLVTARDTMTGFDKPAPAVSAGGGGSKKAMKAAADKELGFALEMKIQIKRAEREKKRQELEADFVGVREEVELKRRELERVVAAITEIEFTRERKTAEFHRMQANLMELLREQKHELDLVKEKGVQLEVATATSAAAASATAQRAKDHEERSAAMYSQTEELMKFQFMSMSLSYFSSLNMLKTMRGINADTTTAAITSSADAAAAAAASAAAANLPGIKAGKVLESVSDVVGQEIGLKKKVLEQKTQELEELEEANSHPFPPDVRFWTKEDVGHFLVTLGLQQYRAAFAEAAVDGDFLLVLDPNDCADVLGVEHALHSKKLFLAIDKLRPLSGPDRQKKAAVEREESADAIRGDGPPDVETVFSQVRNGRLKRLEDSLERGFFVDAEDEFGNTALMVACQNCNTQLCEMLLRRGADVNHQNGRGNTPLHYAMAYDPQGVLGEMLISRGGDDTVTNKDGLSCYDGLGGSSSA